MAEPFGMLNGQRVTDQLAEVRNLMDKGLTKEAAIGSYISSQKKKSSFDVTQQDKPVSSATVSSQQAKNVMDNYQSQLSSETNKTMDVLAPEYKLPELKLGEITGGPNPNEGVSYNFSGLSEQQDQYYRRVEDAIANRAEVMTNIIQSTYERHLAEMQRSQAQEAGQIKVQLAKHNVLGSSAGISYVNNLNVRYERERSDLLSKTQELIASSQLDAAELELGLFRDKIEVARQNRMDAVDLHFNYLTNIEKAMTLQDMYQERYSDTLSTWSDAGWTPDKMPEGYLDKLDELYEQPTGTSKGLLEFYNSYGDPEKEQEAAESLKTQLEAAEKLVDVLTKLPKGEIIEFNGVEYTGLGKNADGESKFYENADGNVSLVYYDKNDPAGAQVISLGRIGSGEKADILYDENGLPYLVDKRSGNTKPIVTEDDYINPELLPGLEEWASNIGEVTVHYGEATRFEDYHKGVDIDGTNGQTFSAYFPSDVNEMVVTEVRLGQSDENSGFGNYIVLEDGTGRQYQYSHLFSEDPTTLRVGSVVVPRQVIGRVGRTGSTYGDGDEAHIDMRVRYKGNKRPLTDNAPDFDQESKEPISKEEELVRKEADSLRKELQTRASTKDFNTRISQFSVINAATSAFEQDGDFSNIMDRPNVLEYLKSVTETADGRPGGGLRFYEKLDSTAAGDLALIFAYMKMLDPTSVVREGEQALAIQATGKAQQLMNIPALILQGKKLTPEQRADFLNQAQNQLSSAVVEYKPTFDEFSGLAKRRGVPLEDVFNPTIISTFGGDGEPAVEERFEQELGGVSGVDDLVQNLMSAYGLSEREAKQLVLNEYLTQQ